jgi:hypothetical protein
MDEEDFKKLKDKVGMCKDFYASFKRLPAPFQRLVMGRVKELIVELSAFPEKAQSYDRDRASAWKYFPNNSEILESGDFLPFRSVRLPKDEENHDVVVINFISCYLVKKLDLSAIISANFSKMVGEFTNDKICLISCSYVSFDSYE